MALERDKVLYFSLERYSNEQLFVCQFGVMFVLYVSTVQKNNSFP